MDEFKQKRLRYLQLKKKAGSVSPSTIAETTQPKEPGLMQAGMTMARSYADTQFGSPQDLLMRGDSMVRKGFNKGGELVAEQMGKEGQNPYLAAGVGTAISMAPDIAMAATPETHIKAPKPLFRSVSQPMAQRALGLTKQHLKTPFARGKAAQAAEVALEKNVIPPFGNPKGAMDRAVSLQDESGQAIGAMRESAGSSPIDPIFDSLEAARQRATGGMRGGAWDTVHRKFDEAQETLMSLLNQGDNVPLAAVEQTKKLLSKTVNWVADNVSQESAKQISSAIERGVETIMKGKGIDMAAYGAQKRLFGASKTMQKGLSNEVAAQAGNNAFSLPTMVAGAGQLATGNVPGAAATLGVVEALRRRGMGMGARATEGLGKQFSLRFPLSVPLGVKSILTGQPSDNSTAPNRILKFGTKQVSQENDGSKKTNHSLFNKPSNGGKKEINQNNSDNNSQNNQHKPLFTSSPSENQQNSKPITESIARSFMKAAKAEGLTGEEAKNRARQLAKEAGYKWKR